MDFALSREHEMLRNMVREFAEAELEPNALGLDEKGEFPLDLVRRTAELGLVGMVNSKEYGGSAMGHLARMITIEETSRIYASLGFFFQTGHLGMYALESFGSEEQKAKYLPPLCRAERISCLALTEQSGGSDPSGMQTVATPEGDDYVVNGRKVFISLAGVADVICFVARSGEGYSLFLVEKGTPGFEVTRREPRLGLLTLPVSEFALTNCRLPKANLIGAEGRGLGMAMTAIAAIGRTGAAGVGLGIAKGAYEAATKFAKERQLYGKPIAQLQAVQFILVDMDVDYEAAKWLCYNAAWLLDQGKAPREIASEIARAKLYACDVANRTALKAVQVMGAYGLAPEYHVARRLRDALELLPAAGAQEVMRVTIGGAIAR